MAALRLHDDLASPAAPGAQRSAPPADPARGQRALAERRGLIVVHPGSAAGRVGRSWDVALERLRSAARLGEPLSTRGDGTDGERIAAAIAGERPDVVIAAGGDGTVGTVVQAMHQAASDAQLAIVPIGTANNLARFAGLRSVRRHGMVGIEAAVQAFAGGRERRIDIGSANGRRFVGALATGMDADILATRNRWRARLGLAGTKGGYALYLLSCALHVLRRHGASATLAVDGEPAEPVPRLYNLLVLGIPLYAGEFRFMAADTNGAGCLHLHRFTGARDYLRRYPEAWRRHVRHERGESVRPPRDVRPFVDLVAEMAAPLHWMIDGEEMEPTRRLHVRVVPGGLRLLVPPG